MRPTGLGKDIALGQRSNTFVCLEIQCLSVYTEKPFHGEGLNTGLGLEPLPAVQSALQRNTDGWNILDGPCLSC